MCYAISPAFYNAEISGLGLVSPETSVYSMIDMDKLAARACQGRIRTFHGQRIADQMVRREALRALDYAATEPLRDENHRLACELLRRLAG